jgi:hypothetical protein
MEEACTLGLCIVSPTLAYILPCRTGLDSGEKETWSVFLRILKTLKAGLKKILPLVG